MTFLILIAVIVCAVWGTLLAVRGSVMAGCVVYLVLASCFGPYFWSGDVGGITFTLDRLFLVALCGAFVVQWRLGRTAPQAMSAPDWLLLGLVGWLTASALAHDWRSPDVGAVPVIQHLINGYYIPLTLYFLARRLPLTETNVNGLHAGLAVFGIYLAAIGLLEAAGAWSLVFPRYIANPELGLHFGRSRGPMVHSVSYGVYLATALIAVWLWRSRAPRSRAMLLTALIPAFLAAVYFTKTRTVWLGAGTAVFLTLALTLQGRIRTMALTAMAAAALVVGLAKMDSIVGLKREGTVADTRRSADMRKSFTYVSWLMFCDRPVTGFGFGQFASAKLPYLGDRTVDLQLESIRPYVHHNTFLSILTETGLIGLALFLGVFYHWTKRGWRLARDEAAPAWMRRHAVLWLAVLAIAFWQMIGHEITFTPLDMSLIFFLAGVGTTLAQSRPAASGEGRVARPALEHAFSPAPQLGI
jgi:O-antigen ligase